jgi:hypothetical protein
MIEATFRQQRRGNATRSAVRGLCAGVRPPPHGPHEYASGVGNRGSAHGDDCSAGRYACSLSLSVSPAGTPDTTINAPMMHRVARHLVWLADPRQAADAAAEIIIGSPSTIARHVAIGAHAALATRTSSLRYETSGGRSNAGAAPTSGLSSACQADTPRQQRSHLRGG